MERKKNANFFIGIDLNCNWVQNKTNGMREQMIFVASFSHHPTLSRVMTKKGKKRCRKPTPFKNKAITN
jgi:hypothetical protein